MISEPIRSMRCWHCKKRIPLEHAGDVCPSCLASLSTADYDIAAKETLADLEDIEKGIRKAQIEINGLIEEKERHRIRAIIFKPWLSRANKALQEKKDALSLKERTKKSDLSAYAAARYCCSCWFQETKLLPRTLGGKNSPFKSVKYTQKGEFRVTMENNSIELRGIAGEYRAFDLLASYVEEGHFGYAKLVPSIIVPSAIEGSSKKTTVEIDMLLISQKGIFVFEVKNLGGEVQVSRSKDKGYEVFVRYHDHLGRTTGPRKNDEGVRQNIRHCAALRDFLKKEFGRLSLTNVVLYLDNGGFIEPSKQGKMGIYVVSDKQGSAFAPDVVQSIGRKTVRTREEVDALYHFLKQFTDPTGKRAKAHMRRVSRDTRFYQLLDDFRSFAKYA